MNLILIPIAGIIGLVIAFIIYMGIAKRSGGEGRIAVIGEQIHKGAMVFMKRQRNMANISRYPSSSVALPLLLLVMSECIPRQKRMSAPL